MFQNFQNVQFWSKNANQQSLKMYDWALYKMDNSDFWDFHFDPELYISTCQKKNP